MLVELQARFAMLVTTVQDCVQTFVSVKPLDHVSRPWEKCVFQEDGASPDVFVATKQGILRPKDDLFPE